MGKHSESRNSVKRNSAKSKKLFKTIILIIFISILIGIISYMAYIKSEPKNIVNKLFTELKSGNNEEANKYIDYQQLIYSLDEMLIQEGSNEQILNIEKSLFNSMEWNVENTILNGESAEVLVEVTNKDFIKVITNWMKKLINEKTKGTEVTNNLSLEKLQKTLDETQERKTVIKKIELNKEDGKWKVKVNENLRNLVYPGIDSVVTVLNQNNK